MVENTSESSSPDVLRVKADLEELKNKLQAVVNYLESVKPLLASLKEAAEIEAAEGGEDD